MSFKKRMRSFLRLQDEAHDKIGAVLGHGPPGFRPNESVRHNKFGRGTVILIPINGMGSWVYRVRFKRVMSHKDVPAEFRWARNMDGTRPFTTAPGPCEIDLLSGVIKLDVVSQLGDLVGDE